MSLDSNKRKPQQKPIPKEGQHLALLYAVVDLGTQMKQYKGQPAVETPMIHLSWEFPRLEAVFNPEKGPQKLACFQEYTNSLGAKANFGKMINSWLKKDKPIEKITYEQYTKILGKPCMIQIEHKPNKDYPEIKYANIAGNGVAVYRRPEDVKFPAETSNPKLIFALDHFSWETFNKIPKHLQEKIEHSLEWNKILKEFGPNPASSTAGVVQPTEVMEVEEEFNAGNVAGEIEDDSPF
jgi:hypothetical protein